MASPFTPSQLPSWRSRSSNIGTITPSAVGPTLIKMFPPQLQQRVILSALVQLAHVFGVTPKLGRSPKVNSAATRLFTGQMPFLLPNRQHKINNRESLSVLISNF